MEVVGVLESDYLISKSDFHFCCRDMIQDLRSGVFILVFLYFIISFHLFIFLVLLPVMSFLLQNTCECLTGRRIRDAEKQKKLFIF